MDQKTFTVLLVVCVAGIGNPAGAAMLTFDDVSGTTSYAPIHDGYGGFDWDNFYVMHSNHFPESGYDLGTVSGDYTAWNWIGDPASVGVAPGSTFDFNGAYLTSAWNGQNLRVQGFVGGSLVADRTVSLVTTDPQWFDFDFLGVDMLTFTPAGRDWFAMDNFTYSQSVVPLPGAVLLGMLGLGTAGVKLRRRS